MASSVGSAPAVTPVVVQKGFPVANKYELKIKRITAIVWWAHYGVAFTSLTVSFTISLVLTSSIALVATVVSAIAVGILVTGRLMQMAKPHLPSTLRRILDIMTGLASDALFIPVSAYLFLFKRMASKEERVLQSALAARRAALAAGHPPPPPSRTRPILLVHGFCHNSSGWLFIAKALRAEGYGPIYTIDLGSPFKHIDEYSKAVKKKHDDIAELHGRKDITLIGHSMGAVVNLNYQQKFAPKDSVKCNIAGESPLQGTYAAYLGVLLSLGLSKAARNMTPHSKFIKELNQKASETGHRNIFSMASNGDPIVLPNSFKLLKNQPKEQQVVLNGMGHMQFLYSGKVIDAILAQLAQSHANEHLEIMTTAPCT